MQGLHWEDVDTYGTVNAELPAVETFCIAGVFIVVSPFFHSSPLQSEKLISLTFEFSEQQGSNSTYYYCGFLFYHEMHETG